MNVMQTKDRLVGELSKCNDVKGIAQSGDINAILVPGKSELELLAEEIEKAGNYN